VVAAWRPEQFRPGGKGPVIYRGLRWISGIMLHWFYSEIRREEGENVPPTGPLLVAVNHQNALVDSLVAGWILPRPLRLTAKATLTNNWLIAVLFRLAGVVPLSRPSDELPGEKSMPSRARNNRAFRKIVGALGKDEAVLIFPEGKSHSEGKLAPLKTGLARIALQARDEGVRNLSILPVGLTFENKGMPGSRALARVGPPIQMDTWKGNEPGELTGAIAQCLGELSGDADFEPGEAATQTRRRGALVRLASWWGRTTHEIPVRYARELAVARSTSPDEPAMLTMLFGMALVIASYAVHLLVIGLLTRSVLISFLYLATLVTGAYWTAFEGHQR